MIHYISTNGIGNAWIAAEMQAMMRAGLPMRLHAMRGPHLRFYTSSWARAIDSDTRLIYPLAVLSTIRAMLLAPVRYRSRFCAALVNALFSPRESMRARLAGIAHFFVACCWADQLTRDGDPVTLIHSQWIHSCGTIGMYGAWLLDVPFSFTGHAVDLFRDRTALADKVRRASFIVCISRFHKRLYKRYGASEAKLITARCGIDLAMFKELPPSERSCSRHILSLGRLVEKKGFSTLIDACSLLRDRGVTFRCTIAGDGPLEATLRERIAALDLQDAITLTGAAIAQEQLASFLTSGDIFAQPCVWSQDNDVDGTPRTLMEAMACGTPCVSTRIAGIPDIITDSRSGLLVPPRDAEALADALQRLLDDTALAARLSRGGRQRIEEHFALPDCLEALEARFRAVLGMAPPNQSETIVITTAEADLVST